MDIYTAEVLAGHIKIEYVDGSSEEIDAGIYELKNAGGDTIVQRPAAQADIDRLTALASAFELANPPSEAAVVEVTILGDTVEIKYADGTKEKIAGGVYERNDANNETILERASTSSDLDRLLGLASDGTGGGTGSTNDDGTPDQGSGDAPGTQSGGSGKDVMNGGTGNDTIDGGTGDDRLNGSAGDDVIKGGGGNDRISGGIGNDTVEGAADDDRLSGGSGDDLLSGGNGADTVAGNDGNDTLRGGAGDDRLRGDNGDDLVDGGNGDDRVIGGSGADTVEGGSGSDHYYGGAGADVFVFSADGARDKIHDFQDGADLIDLTAYGFSTAADVLAMAFERAGDVFINFGGGDVLKIDDTALSTITAEDFIL